MKNEVETSQPEDRMEIQEVLDYLKISRATLNRRIAVGAITPLPKPPYLKRRYKMFFLRSDVERLAKLEGIN